MLPQPLERYVGELVGRLRRALEKDLVAVYLTGSAAQGDWIPGRSDVDVIVVCAAPLSEARKRDVIEPVRHRALACPTRCLELVVYDRGSVRSARGPEADFQINLNTGPGIDEHYSFDPAAEPGHWFVIDLDIARAHARPLVGPPPAELIGPIARAYVLAALTQSIEWHRQHEGPSTNAILNACRGWRFAAEGRWSSKSEAATWAVGRGADAALIAEALALREGYRGHLDEAAAHALLAQVRRAIRIAVSSAAT
jgi:predicted nucleotidyltransferase